MQDHIERKIPQIRSSELLRTGRVAFTQGNRSQAHSLWRQAAAISPGDEQIWLALLQVVETEEDRRVCLENVLAINPNNIQAERQLHAVQALHSMYRQYDIPAVSVKPWPSRIKLVLVPLTIGLIIVIGLLITSGMVSDLLAF